MKTPSAVFGATEAAALRKKVLRLARKKICTNEQLCSSFNACGEIRGAGVIWTCFQKTMLRH
jgi:hypothetical protein